VVGGVAPVRYMDVAVVNAEGGVVVTAVTVMPARGSMPSSVSMERKVHSREIVDKESDISSFELKRKISSLPLDRGHCR
jgi:hypothetical protein